MIKFSVNFSKFDYVPVNEKLNLLKYSEISETIFYVFISEYPN